MERARQHLRGGRSLHLRSPFAVDQPLAENVLLSTKRKNSSSEPIFELNLNQLEGIRGPSSERRPQQECNGLAITVIIRGEEVLGTSTISRLPLVEVTQSRQGIVYQGQTQVESAIQDLLQREWIQASQKKGSRQL